MPMAGVMSRSAKPAFTLDKASGAGLVPVGATLGAAAEAFQINAQVDKPATSVRHRAWSGFMGIAYGSTRGKCSKQRTICGVVVIFARADGKIRWVGDDGHGTLVS